MRLRPEQHDTLAAAIGRRDWTRARTDFERATLVLKHISGFGEEHVTPAQLAVAMGTMPLNAQDIGNYADMACALAAVSSPLTEAAPDLLAACKAQREAIDTLFAMLITLTKDDEPHCFFPSKCGQPWEALIQGNAAVAKATAVRT